jgi:hypothetical protein
VVGRPEIRLADAEVDDVPAFGGELGGAGKNRECVLLADPVKAGNGVKHGCFPLNTFQFDFAPAIGA